MGTFEETLTRKIYTTLLYACLYVSKPKTKENRWKESFKDVSKKKEKENMKSLSFITQFKIEFLLLLTYFRKVLGKMPGYIQIHSKA